MKIFVTAKPSAKEEKIKKVDEARFAVSVKEPSVRGRANAAIAKVVAEYFGVALSRIRLLSGFSSKQKVFEIL